MRTMHLYPQPIETRRGWTRRGCRIERRDGGRRVGEEILWFEFTPQPEQLPDHDAEAYLLAAFMAAMREGRTLRAHGAVSTQLLSNLTEFRDAFHCWLPEKYHPVEFDAEARLPAGPPAPGAICAFSGGVDAAFLVWRHTQRLNGHRSQPLQLAIMVHGFDIPLSEARAFERAALRAEKTLSTVRLPLARLRTNYRAALNVQWEYEYMVGLAAALQNFKRRGGAAVVGSSEPYNALAIPWGSSPLTDHLLSSADLLILHDGAALNRTEKVAVLSDWREACANLRVCWEGGLSDRNCGECEKCLRTRLNFLANRLEIPPSLPRGEVTPEEISRLPIRSHLVHTEFRQLLQVAERNGIEAPWVAALAERLAAPPDPSASHPGSRWRRRLLRWRRRVTDTFSHRRAA